MNFKFFIGIIFIFHFSNFFLYSSDLGNYVEEKVLKIKELQKKSFLPKTKEENDSLKRIFDINSYFQILTNLKPNSSFSFDYVMNYDQLCFYPIILAMDNETKVFFNFVNSLSQEPSEDSLKLIRRKIDSIFNENCITSEEFPDLPQSVTSENCIGYMKYINIKNTTEGYLEFVILRIIGNQFLLGWHAGYNDREPVTTKEKLEKILKSKMNKSIKDFPSTILEKINPSVEINGNNIIVKMAVFTDWGGLIECIYSLERKNYIEIKDVKENKLIDYDCGINF